jgi:hypothetical protein
VVEGAWYELMLLSTLDFSCDFFSYSLIVEKFIDWLTILLSSLERLALRLLPIYDLIYSSNYDW